MNHEIPINVRQVEAMRTTSPIPPELNPKQPQDVSAIVPPGEDNSTVAGLVAVYSDLLMLHALAVEHFQAPADELTEPIKKRDEGQEN